MEQIIIKRTDKDTWVLYLDNILMATFNVCELGYLQQLASSYLQKLSYPPNLPLEEVPRHSPFGEHFIRRLNGMNKKEMIETLRGIQVTTKSNQLCCKKDQ